MSEKRSNFTAKIGFVPAAAGSAVGLGTFGDSHILPLNTAAVYSC